MTFSFFVSKLVFSFCFVFNFQQRRPPQFFSNLRESVNTMKNIIDYEKIEHVDGLNAFEKIDHLLHTYSCETSDLIHEYYLNRYYRQQTIDSTEHGQLTIRCGFTAENDLEVRNLDMFSSHFA